MNRGLKNLLAFVTITASALLAGCGGGGSHNSSGTGVLSVSIEGDAGSASGPIGTSHHLVVYRTDGTIVDEKTVDLSSGTRQVNFSNLPAGTLHLHIGLAATTGGLEIGAVDTTVPGASAPPPVVVTMAQTVSTVQVLPASTSVDVGATQQFYAAAKTADGKFVYSAPAAWTWSSDTPAFATVTSTGTVTGVAVGGSTITALYVPSSINGTASVSVTSDVPTRSKWTIMVFLNASNTLYPYAVQNMNQIEKIANNPDVRFVVQWKQVRGLDGNDDPLFSGTRRYLAAYDSTSLSSSANTIKSNLIQDLGDGIDMGSSDTLANFISWTKSKYPADHYAIVLWNHGAGWNTPRAARLISRGISYDDESGNHMDPWDVNTALAGQHFDVLAYDACLMQGAEDLLEIADKSDYIVGSEENTPGPGYPYHLVFKPFVDTPDTAVPDLAKSLVTAYQSYYASDPTWKTQQLHQSVLDTSKVVAFRNALDTLGSALVTNASTVGPVMNSIRSACGRIAPGDGYTYYDLDQVSEQIAAQTTGTTVTAANALRTAIADMTVLSQGNSHGLFMKGVSIEFGHSASMNGTYGSLYSNLKLANLTHWDEFLTNPTANP